jgi:membrane-bound metal-dependent hydrolase YbcI (DUF457 family)
MPSPVGHCVIGLALGLARLLPGKFDWRDLARQVWGQRGWFLLCLVLAGAPDIDFLFGISRGNLNFYHQTGTHTLVWIALVSLSVWLLVWSRRHGRSAWGFCFILALTGSHLLADIFCVDKAPPHGIMLGWPLSKHYWLSPVPLFPAVAKRNWSDLWSWHNLGVIGVELAVTLPLVGAVLLWQRWLKKRE